MAKKRSKEEIMAERFENTARQTEQLEAQGYHAEDATVSILKANILAFVTAIPIVVLFLILFRVLHPDILPEQFFTKPSSGGLLLALLALSIPVHEGFHGLGWVGFCQKKWQSIQFGVMWDSLTPYCHCREPLTVLQYYVGLLLPCTMLGFIPCIAGLIFANWFLMFFGFVSIFLAGGDLTIGCIIVKYLGKDAKILDHPDQCGAVAFVRARTGQLAS